MVQERVLANFFGTLTCNRMLPAGEDGTLWLLEGGFVWL